MANKKSHIYIAGTGRAGTSFLVRFLTEAGLETTLSRRKDMAFWDERAQAGLEESPGAISSNDLPYIVKSPALHLVAGQLAAAPESVRAVIIPVRELGTSAASRTIVQHQAAQSAHPWLATLDGPWEENFGAAGGAIFSAHPLDQARILAVGFHRLVETLVRHDIPMIFLNFPRLATDPDYLFDKLGPVFPAMTRESTHAALARLASKESIRVEAEIAATPGDPALLAIENIALKREIQRLREAAKVPTPPVGPIETAPPPAPRPKRHKRTKRRFGPGLWRRLLGSS